MSKISYDGGLTAAYNVSDCAKSIAWYQDVLGFKLQYHLEEMGWCEMESHVPRVNVGLSQVENPEVKGGPTLTWGVKDIDAARAEMEAKGVRFDGETREIEGMVRLAGFFDPDGNHLMLYQSLA
ncbi:MAG TPA: VOC family protein [Fimbriimonadaceae bacterium]|nr:VOC family protein [Fimbriimonadaceae bacterium]